MTHVPEGVEPPVLDGDGATLASAWVARWRADPTATALVPLGKGPGPSPKVALGGGPGPSPHTELGEGPGPFSDTLTRGDLEARSAAAAGVLQAAGVRRGDRVLFSGAPGVAYLLLYLGAVRLGAVVVPANTGYTRTELDHLVGDSGATLAVVDDPARIDLPSVVPAGASFAGPAADGLDASAPDDVAMIAYTSGTTGRPKGAMLTHRNLLASARAVVCAWRWTAADGLVLALPLFHMHGLGVGVHGSLVAGGRILLVGQFDPDAVAAAAARDDATMFFGVPTMHKRLVEHPAAVEALRTLRLVVSGSAPLSEELWTRIRDATGQEVLERYGMTETIMNISNPYDGERRPGTVGLPLPGVEVRLDGDPGEILLRGPNVFGGYHERPDATADAFTADGWFRTGDVATRSDDGYIRIVGRSKELIITGGYNVYPREVEEVLERHPAVAEAAVVGLPSEEWGERVVAFVVPAADAEPPDEAELNALVAERLAPYKKPRAYRVVGALARNALGKVERTKLARSFDT